MEKLKCTYLTRISAMTLVAALWCACQSDSPASTNSPTDGTTADVSTAAPAPPADPAKMYADAKDQARKLEQQFVQFSNQLKTLQQQIDAVPTAAKTAAVDFPELEAQMEGFSEKSAYYQGLLRQAAQTLQATGAPGGEGSPESEGDWNRQLQEAADGWEGFKAALPALEKAVERLKKGGGQPIRLFE